MISFSNDTTDWAAPEWKESVFPDHLHAGGLPVDDSARMLVRVHTHGSERQCWRVYLTGPDAVDLARRVARACAPIATNISVVRDYGKPGVYRYGKALRVSLRVSVDVTGRRVPRCKPPVLAVPAKLEQGVW